MMKSLLYAAVFTLASHVTHGAELSFAFEGDAKQRERLSSLQGAKKPPAWELKQWENSAALNLEGLKGKIVVLDFWATWCAPCLASIPHNNQIYERYKKDVVFIGVCHPRGSEKMKEMIRSKGIKYPVAIDPEGKTIKAYAVNGFPDYYVFDREGTLVVADCSNSQVENVLAKMLNR